MPQFQVYVVGTHQRLKTFHGEGSGEAVAYAQAHKVISGVDCYVVELRAIYTTRTASDEFGRAVQGSNQTVREMLQSSGAKFDPTEGAQ